MHRSEDIPGGREGDEHSPVGTYTRDTITGKLELPKGVVGRIMVLTLHDGNKLKIIIESDGKVTGFGDFFR